LSQTDPQHHPTAEEIHSAVKATIPHISLATVYKSVEALEACGVVTRLAGGAGSSSARFDARGDCHYHLRCLRSGEVEDLETPFDPDLVAKLDPELKAKLEARGFHVTGYRLEVVGFFQSPQTRSGNPKTS
jgi:Fe2+ or Zn2+ uptake regulation protein